MARLLDLFCGAGGCSVGYHRAGFHVVGIDRVGQPRYPYLFIQHDAIAWLEKYVDRLHTVFDAIHASPPCQTYSTIGKQSRKMHDGLEHDDFLAPTRELLIATGLPYVIENVPGAPLINPVTICGSSVGLNVRRHRLFETNWPLFAPPCAHGWQTPRFRSLDKRRNNMMSTVPVHDGGQVNLTASVVGVHGHINYKGEKELREWAMGIDWMSPYELTQAIPPAYTELIGHQLAAHIAASKEEVH